MTGGVTTNLTSRHDVIVIGAGLGGLTAAAILARAGRKVLLIERGNSVGGAASSYKVGDLFVEGSLHATSDPRHQSDVKHGPLSRAGVLEAVTFVRIGQLYEVRGGPLDAPLVLPDSHEGTAAALITRFPEAKTAIARFLGDMTAIAKGAKPAPAEAQWTLAQKLAACFDGNEAIKCTLAANLSYYHDDPATLSWPAFAAAQGAYLVSGAAFVDGGSQRLSSALARAIRAAGSEVLIRRAARLVTSQPGGLFRVTHTAKDGGDARQAEAPRIISGAAPEVTASWLAPMDSEKLREAFAADQPSISLFALTLGLARPPRSAGLRSYSTQLLPPWLKSLASYRRGTSLMADEPADLMPPLSLANYPAIDGGVPAPPYVLSVVGPDRAANWDGMDVDGYRARRSRWQAAIIRYLDGAYPGLAATVTAASFNTGLSVRQYLGTPQGAVYGFAPTPAGYAARRLRSALSPIPGLYFASAWSGGGGFSGAISGGASAADAVLAEA